jgi:tRNA U34 5-methylaminomethyl-2-thiouridine-forming methyltransferase MnmC
MPISVKNTGDGSTTLFNSELNEHYHSIHGALTESLHIFIQNGFLPATQSFGREINILEVGFGTGLNAALTATESNKGACNVQYTALEPYPVAGELLSELKYEQILDENQQLNFKKIHAAKWEEGIAINPHFNIQKTIKGILTFQPVRLFHLIYFDAFAPEKQPDMWTIEVLQKCYGLLGPRGIFITYCAKGQFKRNLKECGFKVESRPGPPFKREITFAVK